MSSTSIASVLSALHAGEEEQQHQKGPRPPGPGAAFITISRQPGIDTEPFTDHLLKRLDASSPGWKVWDRALVEKVAADQHVATELVAALGQSSRNWLEDFMRGLAISAAPPEESSLYRGVATTVRALAQAGKAILVGRGAVHVTSDMPGGVHVRLVAPWGYRVWRLAEEQGISRELAAKNMQTLEHERELFYRRFWQQHAPPPEAFSITLNAVAGDPQQLAECVLPLVEAARARCTRKPQENVVAASR